MKLVQVDGPCNASTPARPGIKLGLVRLGKAGGKVGNYIFQFLASGKGFLGLRIKHRNNHH